MVVCLKESEMGKHQGKKGQEFHELPDTYTIFITEKDFYGKGEPIYPIERINVVTGESFDDGEHILYVNGEYRGDSDIGKLMHDFNCTEADDMNFELMAERTRYLKENPEGVSEVSAIVEEMCNEAAEKRLLKDIMNLMNSTQWTAEQAMEALKVPVIDRVRFAERLRASGGQRDTI